ncbi:MAG TPA: Hpt domain-containing protein, partial [Rhizomicrobium sp.]|nr:Hpt domain-containing protein [Rhizomicrobium sp.]
PGIARQAHMMVSSAGNLGAMRTSALAREVEQFCGAGDPQGLGPLLDELRRACMQSGAAIQAWRDSKRIAIPASA